MTLTDIAILLWIGALFGFGIGRYFRLRATYKGRKQTRQSNVFPMDRKGPYRSINAPHGRLWFYALRDKNGTDDIPF